MNGRHKCDKSTSDPTPPDDVDHEEDEYSGYEPYDTLEEKLL